MENEYRLKVSKSLASERKQGVRKKLHFVVK